MAYLRTLLVNLFFYGRPGAASGSWVLIDAGLPGSAPWILAAAASRSHSRRRGDGCTVTLLPPRALRFRRSDPATALRRLSAEEMLQALRLLARDFDRMAVPPQGRYVREPAVADERGVIAVPPAAPDPLPRILLGVGLALVAGAVLRRRFARAC